MYDRRRLPAGENIFIVRVKITACRSSGTSGVKTSGNALKSAAIVSQEIAGAGVGFRGTAITVDRKPDTVRGRAREVPLNMVAGRANAGGE